MSNATESQLQQKILVSNCMNFVLSNFGHSSLLTKFLNSYTKFTSLHACSIFYNTEENNIYM